MPNRLILEVGAGQVEYPLELTATQIRAIVKRFAIRRGVDVVGMNDSQIGRAALRQVAIMIRDSSVDQQRQEGLPAAVATLEATIQADNALISDQEVLP